MVGALVLVLIALVVVPATAAADPLYWGGTIKGEVWGIGGEVPTNPQVLANFEGDTGKKLTMVNTGQSWARFDKSTMESVIGIGAIPLVTMPLGENVTLKEVVEGKQDGAIESWARAAKEFGYPFLFRPWWEVNGTWYSWGRSSEYVAAWQHFYDIVVKRVGATNVTWDWVVDAIWNDPASNPTPWYPGNEYVDWVGMDAYNWGRSPVQSASWLNAEESIQPTLEVLEEVAPGKPVCICESASTEYDETGKPPKPAKKAAWIHEMLDTYLPSHPSIKAYLWFDWNIEKNGERYDWPIESSEQATQAFREGIAAPDYLSVRPPLTKLAKVPMPVLPPPPPPPPVATDPVEEVPAPGGPAPTSGGSGSATTTTVNQPGQAPGAAVTFGSPRLQRPAGMAKVPLLVPGAGQLRITAHGARVSILPDAGPGTPAVSRRIAGTERLVLEVGATGSSRRALRAHGKTTVTVLVRFTPSGGKALQRRLTLTLREQS